MNESYINGNNKLARLRKATEKRRQERYEALKDILKEEPAYNPVVVTGEEVPELQVVAKDEVINKVATKMADPVIQFRSICKARKLDSQYVIPFAVKQICELLEELPSKDDPDVTYEKQEEALAIYLQDNPDAWDKYSYLKPLED